MHIHSSHPTSPGNSHMHGMCRGEVTVFYHHRNDREQPHAQNVSSEVTVFYHHRNDREQPHARNVSRRSHGLLPQPQRQGTATCTECVEAKSRVLPPQQQGTATCTKVSRRSTSLLTRCDCHGGGFEPTTPRIRQDPGALPLSYHDLMSVRANFWSYIFQGSILLCSGQNSINLKTFVFVMKE